MPLKEPQGKIVLSEEYGRGKHLKKVAFFLWIAAWEAILTCTLGCDEIFGEFVLYVLKRWRTMNHLLLHCKGIMEKFVCGSWSPPGKA